ncbi:hypothetical protein KIW84_055896 [Lathyrus oleraceus]|uniref:Retrovirus-related Pol polyprotein from transposon TNT 1-94-like beta-barrel domain-containing protein n=1 Tax=Pisum sativum TaxID=3888 RepID=A0A9D5AJ10_PEA|nr:hypothetical protein KIW84_055896 [Pisum sativum]
MKLRPKFEVVRGALLNRNLVPSLDTCVGELLREEQRLATQGTMSHEVVVSEPTVPELIQQMVLSALSALGIQGKSYNISRPWFLDSSASNHMTGSSEYLHNLQSYHGNQKIQIADGNTLSITNVGDINSDFRDVLVSPRLASNLLSVGQLVDKNYDVNFSRDGCLVQEQVSGKVIAFKQSSSQAIQGFPLYKSRWYFLGMSTTWYYLELIWARGSFWSKFPKWLRLKFIRHCQGHLRTIQSNDQSIKDVRPLIGHLFPILFSLVESDVRPLIGHLFPILFSFVESDVRPLIGHLFPILFSFVESDVRPLIGHLFPILFSFVESDVRPLIGHLFPILFSFVESDVRPLIGHLFPILLSLVESDVRPLIGYLFPILFSFVELDVRPFIGTPFPILFRSWM